MCDPNETLRDLRALSSALAEHPHMSVRSLAQAFHELDDWLSAGNVGPRLWAIGRAQAEMNRG